MNTNEQPIFRQIIDRINSGIESGIYTRGEAIPSEPELCRLFDTTRMTVRRAIDALVNEGKLFRVQGKGTFVSHLELNKTYQKHGFSSNMLSLGMRPSSRVLYIGECAADNMIRSHLELEPDEPVFCLKRIRLADQEPIAIERVWISLKRFPLLTQYDFSQESLYDVLRREYGVKTEYSKQQINAITLEGEDAQLLFHAKKGVALRIRSVDYGKGLKPIAASHSVYSGAKYTLDILI
ncbi:MAG: GntR family transcriptional regulator [Eubacteriales bacterium]|nr:GntR family transcriptional regulator [Eubacteriales bacterium]